MQAKPQNPVAAAPQRRTTTSHVVIVGGGFGGLAAAKELGRAGIDTTVVDRHNHHLFQPLLYQVATSALSATDVAEPTRKVLRDHKSVTVLLGEVTAIDTAARRLTLADGSALDYDMLILAPGAGHGYFGHDEWAGIAPGLKTLEDAQHIRARTLLAFEQAERTADPVEQRRLMTLAVVGGGPTGVELAGSLAELSRYTLARDFRNIHPETARIMLIEAGPQLLSGFSDKASRYARERLVRLGVEVLTDTAVKGMDTRTLTIGEETVPVGTVLWAAGVKASRLGAALGVETDRAGRVSVDPTLAVEGLSNVFAIGDVAKCLDEDGEPLPGLAQVAKQQGRHLGRSLASHLSKGTPLAPFRYHGRGNTAIVGRNAAVFEQGRFRVTGWLAWASWALIHVYLLVGFQNRMLVSLRWLWRYLTYESGARLITGRNGDGKAAAAPTPTAPKNPPAAAPAGKAPGPS
jgi:NADH dehydrogenase